MFILKKAFVIHNNEFIRNDKSDKYFTIFNNTFEWKYNEYNGHKLNRQTCVFANK